jgi:hypothetical protein
MAATVAKIAGMLRRTIWTTVWLALSVVGKWIIDNGLFDWFVHFLDDHGISEANVIASISSYVFPCILSAIILNGAWRFARYEARASVSTAPPPERAIQAIFDPRIPPCHSESTFTDENRTTSIRGMCFRIQVETATGENIPSCEGHLVEVRYQGDLVELGPMSLTWASEQTLKVDLKGGLKRYLDILVI